MSTTNRPAYTVKGGDTVLHLGRNLEVFDTYPSPRSGWTCIRVIDGGQVVSVPMPDDAVVTVIG